LVDNEEGNGVRRKMGKDEGKEIRGEETTREDSEEASSSRENKFFGFF